MGSRSARKAAHKGAHKAKRMVTAYHEAGHAVALRILGMPFEFVTIEAANGLAGCVRRLEDPFDRSYGVAFLLCRAHSVREAIPLDSIGNLRVLNPRGPSNACCGISECSDPASSFYFTPIGIHWSPEHLAKSIIARIAGPFAAIMHTRVELFDVYDFMKVEAYLTALLLLKVAMTKDDLSKAANVLLSEHWTLVSALANALLKEKTITGDRAVEIMTQAPNATPSKSILEGEKNARRF